MVNSFNRSFIIASAWPPPGTIPSSKAQLTALTASSYLSNFSLTSTVDTPPTLMIAIFPIKLAIRRSNKSFDCPSSVPLLSTCKLLACFLQASDNITLVKVDFSFPISILSTCPCITFVVLNVTAFAPVNISKSLTRFFLCPPNPGVFINAIDIAPLL